MTTPAMIDMSRDVVRSLFGDRVVFAAPVAAADRDAYSRRAALRNLDGCVSTWVDEEGNPAEPPAAFTETLARGRRGELTGEELRMQGEMRGGDIRVSSFPVSVRPGGDVTEAPRRGDGRDRRLSLVDELRVRREALAELERLPAPAGRSSKPRWLLEDPSDAKPRVDERFDPAGEPTFETTGVRIRQSADRPVTIRLGSRAWERIRSEARHHAGERECAGALLARYAPTWEKVVYVASANELGRNKTWGSVFMSRDDLDRDTDPEAGFNLVGSWHAQPEGCLDPSCGDVVAWRAELEEAHARYGHVRQVNIIVAASRDGGWSRPAIAAWSLRLEPWIAGEYRFYLEPAIVEAS